MAKVTNAFSTYMAKGNREDLASAIYNIDPVDTIFLTMSEVRDIKNVVYDWQTESLPAVDGNNAQIEGFELVRKPSTPTVRIGNVAQISERDATVTGTQEEADAAGKSGEMSHQMALAGKALKRDMETILLSQQPRNDGADDTTARKTRGLEHWITTNVDYGAGGSNGANATTALTDGTQRAFTEGLLANTIQAAYDNGAEPDHLLMGSNVKRQFSTFTGRTASRVTIDQDEILAYADFYLSDFGELKAYPSRWIRSRTVIGWDPEYTKVAYYRKFVKVDIAKIGDAETKLILSEYGLQCSNEKAHFKIADLLTNVTPTFGAMAAGAQSAPVTNATLTATPNATDPSEVSVTTSPNTAGVIDWGDGTPTAAFSGSGSHIYNAPGDFTVTLRDNGGVTLGTVNVNVPV